ncbi:hypothetical protein HNY42_14805 [Exiguobacterium sp. Helios]|uniref:metalloprotease family protein n=1 Tax=Exiguobacterium sp. Helios TaxID=2735868 RepID=UPI00165E4B74|nr:metalloprotease family protein [Exiguobacterium sp. Helios]QNR22161.1 hypothetical protein HNY42_14805 [Exiguobacterium sp. Helios]
MTAETLLLLISYVLLIALVVTIHESIHWCFALLFRRQPRVTFDRFLTPTVRYHNTHVDWQNLIISASAPLLLFSFGIWVEGNSGAWVVVKILCLANVFNFFPITTDGQMIFLSLVNMIQKQRRCKIKKLTQKSASLQNQKK